jgi:TAG lipase/steryl ester hydrolase/phospholipase A2/LPA acyltransferase
MEQSFRTAVLTKLICLCITWTKFAAGVAFGVVKMVTVFSNWLIAMIPVREKEGSVLSNEREEIVRELEKASTWKLYKSFAQLLDTIDGKRAWQETAESPLYNFRLLEQRISHLRAARHIAKETGDPTNLVSVLTTGISRQTGGLGSSDLYVCHSGTKNLIGDYLAEMVAQIRFIVHTEFGASLNAAKKLSFFKQLAHSHGNSALLLSGGASLGMYHLGVVKALFANNLLPRHISGSSAGAIVGSLICSRTDDKLHEV